MFWLWRVAFANYIIISHKAKGVLFVFTVHNITFVLHGGPCTRFIPMYLIKDLLINIII